MSTAQHESNCEYCSAGNGYRDRCIGLEFQSWFRPNTTPTHVATTAVQDRDPGQSAVTCCFRCSEPPRSALELCVLDRHCMQSVVWAPCHRHSSYNSVFGHAPISTPPPCRQSIAAVTQLKSLSVTVPLYAMAYAHRDLAWHSWAAAARIADHAFSPRCLSSMPSLQHLSIDLQHGMMRTLRPDDAPLPAGARPLVRESACVWALPSCPLTSLTLSGVALGHQQLNYQPATKVRRHCGCLGDSQQLLFTA